MPQTVWGKTPQEKMAVGHKATVAKNTVKIMATTVSCLLCNDLKKYNFLFRFGTFGTIDAL